ncbi:MULTISPECIES: alpha/beta hydrolase [Caulobacter]|jgi:pimeloyl-ACP methyl ester carboxylesterase|uniref:Putative hydrolase or acyltransferase of alpha/beta superfamily n=1 Tax=Caulobacter vibrioides OR37 TaxID=1292034 RepID=R0CXW1_CAUVI|nr:MULTISPECIES: alpha/beta hydrolase [Caulobacter]ENZ81321.1 putative hydrolase or acyltransferase of alpha/beta superfamily [Caulobacter vibrioides OR37]MBQ1560422.1 alpha/beta hydrolase [Caulobacter sp.]
MRVFCIALLVTACLSPSVSLAQAPPKMSAGSPELLDKHLIDIGGGRKLNMVCMGKGAPTLVFEQALGGTILDWQHIQVELSKTNRTCFYDRAGYGQSPASDQPRTPRNVTDDLHALLRKAGERRPVVLIGHSIGGRYAPYYYERFPADVAGMVLVDPGFYGQDDLGLSAADQTFFDGLRTKVYAKWSNCAAKARSHEITLEATQGCFAAKLPYYTRDEAARMLPVFQRPERWETIASEYGHIDEDKGPRKTWGDLPLAVLTRTEFPPTPRASEAFNQSVEAVLKRGHAALAARSSRGENITVPNSNHYMQANQPGPVLAAIRKVVAEASAGASR